jgi:hypothetical protein
MYICVSLVVCIFMCCCILGISKKGVQTNHARMVCDKGVKLPVTSTSSMASFFKECGLSTSELHHTIDCRQYYAVVCCTIHYWYPVVARWLMCPIQWSYYILAVPLCTPLCMWAHLCLVILLHYVLLKALSMVSIIVSSFLVNP